MSRIIAIGVALVFGWNSCSVVCAADPSVDPAPMPPAVSARELAIEAILKKPVTLDIDEKLLASAMAQLSEQVGLDIRIDEKSLIDAAIDPSVTVTFKTPTPMPLGEALDRILEDLELTHVIQHESLRVMSKEKADYILTRRIYAVGDLVAGPAGDGREGSTVNYLMSMIEDLIEPDTWATNSGAGSMIPSSIPNSPSLIVTATRSVHREIVAFLTDLRAGKTVCAENGSEIEAALKQPTKFEWQDQSLSDAVAKLAELHKLPIHLDHKALTDAAIDPSVSIQFKVRDPISLRAALDLLLENFELTYVVQRGAVRITSKEKADCFLTTRVYPVGDFISTDPDRQANQGRIADIITESIAPDSWDEDSGPGILRLIQGPKGWVAIVRNSDRVQREVADLFAQLRAARQAAPAAQPAAGASNATAAEPGAVKAEIHPPAKPDLADEEPRIVRYELRHMAPDEAVKAVTELVAPESWRSAGGTGVVSVTKVTEAQNPAVKDQTPRSWTYLIIKQMPRIQREVRKLLKEIDRVPIGMSGLGGSVMGASP